MESFRWSSVQPLSLASVVSGQASSSDAMRALVFSLAHRMNIDSLADHYQVTLSPDYALANLQQINATPVYLAFHFQNSFDNLLGSLLSRAASSSQCAKIIVVCSELKAEYVQKIHWLNEITIDSLEVKAVELSFWQLDQSERLLAAISQRVEAQGISQGIEFLQPDMTLRSSKSLQKNTLPQYTEFWLNFNNELLKRKSEIVGQKPQNKPWVSFALNNEFSLAVSVNPVAKRCLVGLVMRGQNALNYYEKLHEMRSSIEDELDMSAEWETKKDRNLCRIFVKHVNFNFADKQQWPALQAWLVDMLEIFQRVFALKIEALHLQKRFITARETGLKHRSNWEAASGS